MHVIVGLFVAFTVIGLTLSSAERRRGCLLPTVPPEQRAEDDALRGRAEPHTPSLGGRR